jgi:hypothetical protein
MVYRYFKYIFLALILYNMSFLYAVESNKLMGLVIPLYSYPTDQQAGIGGIWDAVADAGENIPITVVMGAVVPHDDPIGMPNDDYIEGLEKLHSSGIEVLAYVSTDKGQRDIDIVKSEIYDYAVYFDIDGIFLDEGVATDEIALYTLEERNQIMAYYEEVSAYVKSFDKLKKLMLNVSYIVKEDILDLRMENIDDFVVFENYIDEWDTFEPSQYEDLDYRRLHIIVHGDNNSSGEHYIDSSIMKDRIKESAENNIVNVYFTDKEFHSLPSFWYDEVATIQAYNNIQKAAHTPILYYLLN